MLTRRQLIKTGIAGGIVLAGARFAYGPIGDTIQEFDNGYDYKFLTAADRATLAAISAVVLEGAMPDGDDNTSKSRIKVVRGLDKAITGLTPSVQMEIRDLMTVLNFPITRRFLACVWKPWHLAERADIERFLNDWRDSRFLLFRSGYNALCELTLASWYGDPGSWSAIGYGGPPDILEEY